MILKIIFSLVVIAACIQIGTSIGIGASCPNGTFITKHLNTQQTYDDPRVDGKAAAERVAEGVSEYRGYKNTNINHIFLTNGLDMSKEEHYDRKDNECKTGHKVDTYECTFGRVWDCTYKGFLYSHHDLSPFTHSWATR